MIQPVVMAVPSRREMAEALAARVGPKTPIVYDVDHEGHVFNWWQAVTAAALYDPSHILILEDDALVCLDLLATCERLVAIRPNEPINLFNRNNVDKARDRGHSWSLVRNPFNDQGAIYPVAWLAELRRRYHARKEEMDALHTWKPDTLGFWGADSMRHFLFPSTVACTVPSLVQHSGVHSTMRGHSVGARPAAWFIGEDASGLSIDWTRGLRRR